jgi:hypothetical protein
MRMVLFLTIAIMFDFVPAFAQEDQCSKSTVNIRVESEDSLFTYFEIETKLEPTDRVSFKKGTVDVAVDIGLIIEGEDSDGRAYRDERSERLDLRRLHFGTYGTTAKTSRAGLATINRRVKAYVKKIDKCTGNLPD